MVRRIRNPRAHGFSQARPRKPGVYFIAIDDSGYWPSTREQNGWDVAWVYWSPDSGVVDARNGGDISPEGHWRVRALAGTERAWVKGMWLKGPLTPFVSTDAIRAALDEAKARS